MAKETEYTELESRGLSDPEAFESLCAEIGVRIDLSSDLSTLARSVRTCEQDIVLTNSLAVHPMEGADGDAWGRPGPLTLRRYERFAAGGAGLIWAEAMAVVPEGRANPRQLWLNDESVEAFSAMVTRMRKVAAQSMGAGHRLFIVAQLTHSGRYSKPDGTPRPLIPQRDPYRDALLPEVLPTTSRPSQVTDDCILSDEYLDKLQDAFVKAARLAYEAGFDAVDLKTCHGYLVNELLASRNRAGKYGGSFENRTRFLLELIEKIRRASGGRPVAVRLGFYDAIPYPYGWGVDERDYTKPNLDEPRKLLSLLGELGVRLVNFTIANPYYNPHLGRPFNQPIKGAYEEPEHPLVGVERLISLAAEIQTDFPDLLLVGTGYSWLGALMGNAGAASLKQGKISIVGAGRMSLAYPDFAKDLLLTGKLDNSRICISCSACTQLMRDGGMAGCVIRDNEVYGPIFRHGRMSNRDNLRRLAADCLDCRQPICVQACPAGIDIPGFIRKFLDGDDRSAYEIIRASNALPEVCAWLCPALEQCQGGCLQNFIGDASLPIADIQRFLASKANKRGWSAIRIPELTSGRSVAIIGAGPAGISAAVLLLEAGHRVTLFDKAQDFGGMIASVIPTERQGGVLKDEITAIFNEVPADRLTLRFSFELSSKFNLDSIMDEGFDAAFIGLGLPKATDSSGAGSPSSPGLGRPAGLYDALEFLHLLKHDRGLDLAGKRIAIIGGGNTALDAALAAIDSGSQDVYIIYRRSFKQMPAWKFELDRALALGIHFLVLTQQLDYSSAGEKLTGVRVCPCLLGEPDQSGRRKSIPDYRNAYFLKVDLVVEALGQRAQENLRELLPGVGLEEGGLIRTKEGSSATDRCGVFAGGDLVRGAATVVAAVADGMQAAEEIDRYLQRLIT